MVAFTVPVVKVLSVDPIEGADKIEVARVFGYQVVVQKGELRAGSLAVYIPEGSIVPNWLLKRIGLEGRLAGKDNNRVKAIKLRKCLSQGLLVPLKDNEILFLKDETPAVVAEGEDVQHHLDIIKYEPPIPIGFGGEMFNPGFEYSFVYDIENVKKEGESLLGQVVEITEKIHGTLMCIVAVPGLNHPKGFFGGNIIISSKGLLGKGLFLADSEANADNIYVRTIKRLYETSYGFREFVQVANCAIKDTDQPVYMFGEVYGRGVQDLSYDKQNPAFALFDVYCGWKGLGVWVDPHSRVALANTLQIDHVPVLGYETFMDQTIQKYTSGTTLAGSEQSKQIREGVVFKTCTVPDRIALKSVSEQYLLRKDGTEYT